MSNSSQPTAKSEGRSLRFHLVAALIVYIIDALYFGQGVITFLVAAAFALTGITKMLAGMFKREHFSRRPLQKAGIYALCFAAVASTIAINNKIARSRAEVVVSAVKQYKTKYNRYPDSLQALVPEFLPSVPLAKYSFAFNDYRYWRREAKAGQDAEEGATLLYVAIPPFGRPTYNFEQDRWGYID